MRPLPVAAALGSSKAEGPDDTPSPLPSSTLSRSHRPSCPWPLRGGLAWDRRVRPPAKREPRQPLPCRSSPASRSLRRGTWRRTPSSRPPGRSTRRRRSRCGRWNAASPGTGGGRGPSSSSPAPVSQDLDGNKPLGYPGRDQTGPRPSRRSTAGLASDPGVLLATDGSPPGLWFPRVRGAQTLPRSAAGRASAPDGWADP